MRTLLLEATGGEVDVSLRKAVELLFEGAIVAVPTETVYGLACDALNEAAVRRLYKVKHRPESKPLPLQLAEPSLLGSVALEVPEAAVLVMNRLCPGPLTLVFRKAVTVPAITTGGSEKVGVRFPDHPVMQRLLRESGGPLAVPSANLSGERPAVTAQEVLGVFDGQVDAVVEGQCGSGVPSTVLDVTTTVPVVLRVGAVSVETLRAILGDVVAST